MKALALLMTMLALAGGIAACGDDGDGGSDSTSTAASGAGDPQAVADAAKNYLLGFAEADGERACAQLTTEAQDALVQASDDGGGEAASDCPSLIDNVAKTSEQDNDFLTQSAEAIAVDDVEIDGDTAALTIAGAAVPVSLELVDGRWLISADYVRQAFQIKSP